MKAELTFKVTKHMEKLTVRQFFDIFHVSRKTIYKLISGYTKLNNQLAKEIDILHENDEITIDFTEVIPRFPSVISKDPITIIYEDEHFVVVSKNVSLLVYDDGNSKGSLTSNVQAYYQNQDYPLPVLPAHRIDEETSGMILFAKHPLALSYLSYLFESKGIKKVYECLVEGTIQKQKGTIHRPIGKDRHDNKMRVSINGDDAITHYEVICLENNNTRVNVMIETGRKHQIRVHLSHLGFPIIGDRLYDGRSNSRLMLHFKEVSFIHPMTNEEIHIKDKAPF